MRKVIPTVGFFILAAFAAANNEALAQMATTSAAAAPEQTQVSLQRPTAEKTAFEESGTLIPSSGEFEIVRIALDNTGVAAWRFRNARNPRWLFGRNAFTDQESRRGKVLFENVSAGAIVKVTLPTVKIPLRPGVTNNDLLGAESDALKAIAGEWRLSLKDCELKAGSVQCVPSFTLVGGEPVSVSAELFLQYPAEQTIKFSVSFPYSLESEQPQNKDGYFSLDEKVRQSPTTAVLSASGAVSYARDPYFGKPAEMLDEGRPYDADSTLQGKLTAKSAFSYAMGDRASASVEVQFKNSALGRKDEDLAAKVNQYHFLFSGVNGTTFKFGKYQFAAPTEGLAINEAGEGATLRYKWFAVSHIIRRESQDGLADGNDRDHFAWLGEVSNLRIRRWKAFRSASFYGLYGQDETAGRERQYFTYGGEAQLILRSRLLATGALYRSDSRALASSPVREADGLSWLARLSRTWTKKVEQAKKGKSTAETTPVNELKPTWTAVMTIAGASGDNRNTGERYEAYIGENAAWSPDGSLFISTAAPRLRLDPVLLIVDSQGNPVLKDGVATPEFTPKGIANYKVLALAATKHAYSPLEWIAKRLTIPQSDIEGKQSVFRLQFYRSSQPYVSGPGRAIEFQAETMLESPKGIKTLVKFSKVFSGRALKNVLHRPWALAVQSIVTLK